MENRDLLVGALERVTAILESRPQDLSGTFYLSPQQPFGDLVQPLWSHRRGSFVQLRQLALLFAPEGPLAKLAEANGWRAELELAQRDFRQAFAALNCVRYCESETPVRLGDHVGLRLFFRRTEGRVSYLPGVSPPNPEIDFGGLFRVGVATRNGSFVACHVDPDSLDLKKGIVLLRRDEHAVPEVPSAEELER